jgi:hypothetical protein
MNKIPHPLEVLTRTAALAKADNNLEMMDCAAVLHGYLELSSLHPEDVSRKQEVEEAVGRLLLAATRYPVWKKGLSEFVAAKGAM